MDGQVTVSLLLSLVLDLDHVLEVLSVLGHREVLQFHSHFAGFSINEGFALGFLLLGLLGLSLLLGGSSLLLSLLLLSQLIFLLLLGKGLLLLNLSFSLCFLLSLSLISCLSIRLEFFKLFLSLNLNCSLDLGKG